MRYKSARKLTAVAIYAIVWLAFFPAFGSAFKTKFPATWKLASSEGETKFIYVNSSSKSNERLVLQVDAIGEKAADFQDQLATRKSDFSQLRAEYFSRAGLTNYAVLDIRNRTKKTDKFRNLTVIESRYRDLRGRDVQMVEKQYIYGSKLFTVTYLVDAASAISPEHYELIMDYAHPAPNPREPASIETLGESADGKPGDQAGAMVSAAPDLVQDLDMSNPANSKRCEAFCHPDASKCRQPGMGGFLDQLNVPKQALACMKGLGQGIWGMAEGIWDTGKFAFNYAKSWITGDDYKTQVHAAVGAVASEFLKDEVGFVKRIGATLWNMGAKAAGDFFLCASPAEQWRQVCDIASNFIPVGVFVKILTKVPMTLAEVAEVNKAFSRGLDKGFKLNPKDVPTLAKTSTDGSISYDLGNGKEAVVPPKTPVKPSADVLAKSGDRVPNEVVKDADKDAVKTSAKVAVSDPIKAPSKVPAQPLNQRPEPLPDTLISHWQSTPEKTQMWRELPSSQRRQIDNLIKESINSKQILSDLETIAKRGQTNSLVEAMSVYSPNGKAADREWLTKTIRNLASNKLEPEEHGATSNRFLKPAATPIENAVRKSNPRSDESKTGKLFADPSRPQPISPEDLKKPDPPASSSSGWERKDSLRNLVRETTPDQLSRIDKVISIGGGEGTIEDLEAISRLNRGPQLARVMESGESKGTAAADRTWLRGKIKELANPNNHTATSVEELTAQALPAGKSPDLARMRAKDSAAIADASKMSGEGALDEADVPGAGNRAQPTIHSGADASARSSAVSHDGVDAGRVSSHRPSVTNDPLADLGIQKSSRELSPAAQKSWADNPSRAQAVQRIKNFDRERVKAGLAPVADDAVAALSRFDDPRTSKVLAALEEALDSRNEQEIGSAHAILNLLKAEKEPDLGQAVKNAMEKYKSKMMCDL